MDFFSKEFKLTFRLNDEDIELPENFENERELGETNNLLTQIIKKDSIVEFIMYSEKNGISLYSKINISKLESNSFLLKNRDKYRNIIYEASLIEYATFYGLIQIFKYLFNNGVELTPSIWLHAIHGKDPEIINLLEENDIKPEDKSFFRCLKEAIKCHHNDVAIYIYDNLISEENKEFINLTELAIKYHNFCFFEKFDLSLFGDICFYDYPTLVKLILQKIDVDINKKYVIIGKRRGKGIKKHESKTYLRDELKTPLYLSIENENIEIIKLLLSCNNIDINLSSQRKGTNYDSIYTYNETPFCLAIRKDCIEIVKLLLSNKKLDINLPSQCDNQSDFGYFFMEKTPLIFAINNENIDIIKILLSYNILDKNKPSKPIERENINPILGPKYAHEIQIDNWKYPTTFCDDSNEEITPLVFAIKNENIEIIKLLISCEKIDINLSSYVKEGHFNGSDKTPLFYAIEKNNLDIVKLLLSHKKINVNLISKQFTNIENANKDNVEWKWDKTPLYYAVEKNNINIIEILLSHNAIDINYVCIGNRIGIYRIKDKGYGKIEKTAFNLAVEGENIEIINLFLENANLNVNAISKHNEITPRSMLYLPKIDQKDDANKERKLKDEKTPLCYAVNVQNIKIIELLLANDKIDVNIPYQYLLNDELKKQTPLHLAVIKNNIEIIKLLLGNKNIIVNAEDEKGKNPIDITNNDEIKKILNNK